MFKEKNISDKCLRDGRLCYKLDLSVNLKVSSGEIPLLVENVYFKYTFNFVVETA